MVNQPTFESDIPLESLKHVERLYTQCIGPPKFTPHPAQVQRAFEIGGDVLKKAAQIYGKYWQQSDEWTQELSTDPFEIFGGWEKHYKGAYCKQTHPGLGIACENQGIWQLIYDPRNRSLWSKVYTEARPLGESLEQAMVSYLLSQMVSRLQWISRHRFDFWIPQLDDTTQWTKLWHRPDFIDGQSLFYKHTQRNVFICCAGITSRTHLYAGQDEYVDDILEQSVNAPHLHPSQTFEMTWVSPQEKYDHYAQDVLFEVFYPDMVRPED